MAKPKTVKEKLEFLGEQLREGWQKLYPVTEEQIKKIRDAMGDQWEKEQKQKAQSKESTKTKSKSHEEDLGHSH